MESNGKETEVLAVDLGNLGKGWDNWFGLNWTIIEKKIILFTIIVKKIPIITESFVFSQIVLLFQLPFRQGSFRREKESIFILKWQPEVLKYF